MTELDKVIAKLNEVLKVTTPANTKFQEGFVKAIKMTKEYVIDLQQQNIKNETTNKS
jgi:hypothetical protein